MAPATDLLKAKADMLVDSSADLMEKYVKAHFEKDETRKVVCTLIIMVSNSIDFLMSL